MKQNNEKQKRVRLPLFGIPRLLPFARPYKKTFFWIIVILTDSTKIMNV